MCGRYWYDENNAELGRWLIEARRRGGISDGDIRTGELRPTDGAVIIRQAGCHIYASGARWGWPFQKKQIFLARLETILEKPMFSESMLYRRCLVPASGFYEWTRHAAKMKYYFSNAGQETVYMAGIWQELEDGVHFVIVTTEADTCMQPVHDRMPVILDQVQADHWLADWQSAVQAAGEAAPELVKECCEQYEQMRMLF